MHRFFLAFTLLFPLTIYGQIDQKKLDSLSRSIDSSAKAYKLWQDSFNKVQDSIYHAAISKNVEQNSRNLNNFIDEQKRRGANEKKQAILRIVLSIVLLVIGVIALVRRRKTKT